LRESGERWVLVVEYMTPREKEGPPKENWIGTLQLPDGTLARLVDVPIKTPDGGKALFVAATYNNDRRVLICASQTVSGLPICDDVWRYDLATGQTRWIAKGKWNKTRGFAWSPDGSKVSFVASIRGEPAAFVMQYDLDADRLERVAGNAFGNRDDPQEGDSSVRPRRPVYSEDGKWLYYVSMDQHVMRVDLRTKHCEQLPISGAIVVLTVKGEHLVYARQVGDRSDWEFEIVKVRLDALDGSVGEQVLHAADGVIWENFVSPSRRFVLLTSRAGYGSMTSLINVDKGASLRAEGLLTNEGFRPHSVAWVSRAP